MMRASLPSASAFVLAVTLPAVLSAQSNHVQVPYDAAPVTLDGVLGLGEWEGALAIFVEGQTPQQNPGWNPLNGNTISPADLSYTLRLKHDGEFFHVSFDVTDDSVSDDYTATRPDHTEVWNDDCTEVFLNGDRDQDATESTGNSPQGDRDWREGQQPHFGVRANSHWDNNSSHKDRNWWAATARHAGGYRTEYRFAFRGIDTADGEGNFEPLKIGDTIGFSALVNDDDNGGNREDQLAWIGGGVNDSLYRTQSFWGTATIAPPPGYQEPGIPTRAENESLLIDSVPGSTPPEVIPQRVFPRLAFERPMLLIESPDDSNRLFVVEQRGRIKTFPRGADPSNTEVVTFLDIVSSTRSLLEAGELEEGLLGMAFDPDFASSGELYVYYSVRSDPRRTRVSRFTANPPGAPTVNAATEEVLLDIPQPSSTHNGGMIAFGPDGMLYIGTGDGGGVGDNAGEGNNAQNTRNLLGDMLRIDVRGTPDPGLAYRIPPDNPFFVSGPAGTQTRKEIWAYGFRNPWRWSFDALTGALLLGDVGQGEWEEIDVVLPGRNYGWRIMEGPLCYNAPNCNQTGLTPPIASYFHSEGIAVTGGFVYYGPDVPSLYGKYVYGDYVTGRLWALTYDPDTETATAPVQIGDLSGFELGAFGQDKTGEVYLLNLTNGAIYVLRPGTPPDPANAVTTVPAPPVRGQSVIITYNSAGRVLADEQQVSIHLGYNGWTNVVTTPMVSSGSGTHSFLFDVPENATVLDMVFTDGEGTWDNNEGQDWHIATTGNSEPEPIVSLSPATPVRGQTVTVTYNATGRILQGQPNVNMHWGFNGWANVTADPMTPLGNNRFSVTVAVPPAATVLDMVFNNGDGLWDNNGQQDWHFATAATRRSDMVERLVQACQGTRPFPTRLSDIPALLDAGLGVDQTNLGILPYEPSAKLFSDYAEKERFIALPGLDQIGYTDIGGWNFEEDAVLIKNFILPLDERDPEGSRRRIETRLLVKNCEEWYGFSYEWNEEQTDAVLLTSSKLRPVTITDKQGATAEYDWLYPSRDQCMVCHTNASNNVLGLTTAQMNHEFLYPRSGQLRNQLEALDYVSIFAEPRLPAPPAELPAMPDPADESASIRDRARAYLAANCSHCHQPGGGGGGGFDLRWHVADEDTRILDKIPAEDLGILDARVVAPGDAERSVLYRRVHTTDPTVRMPPLGRSRIDAEGSAIIREWIESLGDPAPEAHNFWMVR